MVTYIYSNHGNIIGGLQLYIHTSTVKTIINVNSTLIILILYIVELLISAYRVYSNFCGFCGMHVSMTINP